MSIGPIGTGRPSVRLSEHRDEKSSAPRIYRTKDGAEVIIRGAAKADIPEILHIWQSIADEGEHIATERVDEDYRRRLEAHVADWESLVAVADYQGELVGILTLYQYLGKLMKTRHVYALGMGILSGYRVVGVGSSLMDFAIDWARRKGVKKLSLEVFSTNERAISLYRKFGFQVEGVRKAQFFVAGKYVDEVIMGLWLTAQPTPRHETRGSRQASYKRVMNQALTPDGREQKMRGTSPKRL